jgi:hypothetical protein
VQRNRSQHRCQTAPSCSIFLAPFPSADERYATKPFLPLERRSTGSLSLESKCYFLYTAFLVLVQAICLSVLPQTNLSKFSLQPTNEACSHSVSADEGAICNKSFLATGRRLLFLNLRFCCYGLKACLSADKKCDMQQKSAST